MEIFLTERSSLFSLYLSQIRSKKEKINQRRSTDVFLFFSVEMFIIFGCLSKHNKQRAAKQKCKRLFLLRIFDSGLLRSAHFLHTILAFFTLFARRLLRFQNDTLSDQSDNAVRTSWRNPSTRRPRRKPDDLPPPKFVLKPKQKTTVRASSCRAAATLLSDLFFRHGGAIGMDHIDDHLFAT